MKTSSWCRELARGPQRQGSGGCRRRLHQEPSLFAGTLTTQTRSGQSLEHLPETDSHQAICAESAITDSIAGVKIRRHLHRQKRKRFPEIKECVRLEVCWKRAHQEGSFKAKRSRVCPDCLTGQSLCGGCVNRALGQMTPPIVHCVFVSTGRKVTTPQPVTPAGLL